MVTTMLFDADEFFDGIFFNGLRTMDHMDFTGITCYLG